MLPTKIDGSSSESDRRRFKIVDLSSGQDIGPKESWIVNANVETGIARLAWKMPDDKTTEQDFNLGPHGLAIVTRR